MLSARSARRLLVVAAVLISTSVGAFGASTANAGGNGFAISLSASAQYAWTGQSVTVTATTNADVGPTPYFISVYDETAGVEIAVCGEGTTCSGTVTEDSSTTHTFEAFVGDYPAADSAPGFVLVSSNEVSVSWVFHLIIRP